MLAPYGLDLYRQVCLIMAQVHLVSYVEYAVTPNKFRLPLSLPSGLAVHMKLLGTLGEVGDPRR